MTNKAIRPNIVDVNPASREPLTEPYPGAQAYPEITKDEGQINKALKPRAERPNSPSSPMWQDFHSAALITDTNSGYTYVASWQPNYWIVRVAGTAGSVNIHLSSARGGHYVRLDKGTHLIRNSANSLTIETSGFTGFYDVYAAQSLDDFRIMS